MSEQGRASIASDEDMTVGYVLLDEHAPTADAAREALIHGARVDWDQPFVTGADLDEPNRGWFKWEDEERLIPCGPDDPDRDSEWWSFRLPESELIR